jgi:hypothetical protein
VCRDPSFVAVRMNPGGRSWVTALHCTQCSAVQCTALQFHFTALHFTSLHCTALHCTALHCAQYKVHSRKELGHAPQLHQLMPAFSLPLHCTVLHCTALHCTALHCTALQCVTNIRIYSNIRIFLDKYIHLYRYSLDFKATNIFGHSFVELLEFLLSKCSNIFEYSNISGRIYSFIQISVGC